MNTSTLAIGDHLTYIPSGELVEVIGKDEWSVQLHHTASDHTATINSKEGLSLYRKYYILKRAG